MSFTFLTKFILGVFIVILVSFFAKPLEMGLIQFKIKLMEYELQLIDSAIQQKLFFKNIEKNSLHSNQKKFVSFLKNHFSNISMRDYSKDQWGKVLIFTNENKDNSYRVTSSGPDKTINTKDDLILFRENRKVDFSVSPMNILKREIESEESQLINQKKSIKELSKKLKIRCEELHKNLDEENQVYLIDILSEVY